jgi:hypothetical protein
LYFWVHQSGLLKYLFFTYFIFFHSKVKLLKNLLFSFYTFYKLKNFNFHLILLKFAIFPSPLMRQCCVNLWVFHNLAHPNAIRSTTLLDSMWQRLVAIVSISTWLLPCTLWCLEFYVLCIPNIKSTVTCTVQLKLSSLFDERQFLQSQLLLPECLDHMI